MLNLAKYSWSTKQVENEELILAQLQKAGLEHSPAFLRVCIRRGLTTPEAIKEATDQKPQLYHDPHLMFDMDKAIERINQAIDTGEKIVIYGDYDADGITSTLILYEGLMTVGADVSYYLPNRLVDGYGPNLDRYKSLIDEREMTLIITCDNGVAGHEAIDYAQSVGVDVIVTDHHSIQETLPEAYAIIHPAHPEGNYPFHELSGAGVALKLITALLEEIPTELLELAAIGTVADMMSLTDENRTIVLAGLQEMQMTHRIGLEMLLKDASVSMDSINTQTIGFVIGPRLNAVGRLGDPTPGLELLATFDEAEAKELVLFVNTQNNQRKSIEQTIMEEVETKLAEYENLPDIIIEKSPDWAAGVLGITAGKIVRKYHRPTILFQDQGEDFKGSGRSIDDVNLFELLTENKDNIKYFGGHSQAAGMTVDAQNFEAFKETMTQSMEQYQEAVNQPPKLEVDIELATNDITESLVEEFDLLQPFGMDNEEPVVMIEESIISQFRLIGSDKTHVKISVQNKGHRESELQTIGFSMAHQANDLTLGQPIHLVGKLSINEWNNVRMPQLQLEDLGVQSKVWVDVRGSKMPPQLLNLTDAIYVFDRASLAERFEGQVHSGSVITTYKELNNQVVQKRLVLMEPANSMNELEKAVASGDFSQIYLGSYLEESKYMAGLPSREDTTKLYVWVRKQNDFAIRENLAIISQQLSINTTTLKLLFMMFFEAGFVTIDNGVLHNVEKIPEGKTDLTTMDAYLKYEEAMKIEKLMNFEPIDTIKQMFEGK